MNTSEVLNRAADLIGERGWVTGTGWPESAASKSSLCLEGGIMAALGTGMREVDLTEFWGCPAYRAVADYLGRDVTPDASGFYGECAPREPLWKWNDNQSRDLGDRDLAAEHVIEVLRATAVIEAARESKSAEVSA